MLHNSFTTVRALVLLVGTLAKFKFERSHSSTFEHSPLSRALNHGNIQLKCVFLNSSAPHFSISMHCSGQGPMTLSVVPDTVQKLS
jgi:hypothetical protein